MADFRRDDTRQTLWLLVVSVVCCGGVVLLVLATGAGLTGAGVIRGSVWLLIGGVVVVAIGLVWRARRRRRSLGHGNASEAQPEERRRA